MIEKSRVYPQFQYPRERYQIDHFHNPYLSRLNVKLTPKVNPPPLTLLTPFSSHNNLYLSQTIPIHKNQRIKFALVWKQYITHKHARAHFGTSIEYKATENINIKGRVLVGNSSLFDIQLSKKLLTSQVFAGYSGVFENNNLFNTFNFGIRKGIFSAAISHKLDSHSQLSIGARKVLPQGFALQAFLTSNAQQLHTGQIRLGLAQNIDNKSTTNLSLVTSPYFGQASIRVDVDRLITKNQKLVFSTEYLDGKSVLYLGFKNLNFNFIFPIFVVENSIPTVLGVLGYCAVFAWRKLWGKKEIDERRFVDIEQKSQQKRQEQLKLIGEKAADYYEKEKANRRGLLIEQAYIGPDGELQAFMNDPQRAVLLIRNAEYSSKFVDLTVTMRFYVSKGELKLRKGHKFQLLGFHRRQNSHNKIGIRYILHGRQHTQFFDYNDPIVIKNWRQAQ